MEVQVKLSTQVVYENGEGYSMSTRKSTINNFPIGSKVRIKGDTSGNRFIVIGEGLKEDITGISIDGREQSLNELWFNYELELVGE